MKKRIFYLSILLCALACSKKEKVIIIESLDYLVSEVRDYNNLLVAKYIYDENNLLIKKEFTDPINKVSSDLFLEYEDGILKVTRYRDYDFPQFSHDKYYYYSQNNRIIRIDIGNVERTSIHTVWSLDYSEETNKLSLSLHEKNPTIFYDIKDSNIVRTVNILRDARTGEEFEQILNFKFDDKKKPSFGLDYLVGTDLLPFRGTTSHWEKTLSKNNLIAEEEYGTQYIMEYNEQGYPISITTKIDGIETAEPQVLKIIYQ